MVHIYSLLAIVAILAISNDFILAQDVDSTRELDAIDMSNLTTDDGDDSRGLDIVDEDDFMLIDEDSEHGGRSLGKMTKAQRRKYLRWKKQNDAICYKIYETWWHIREGKKDPQSNLVVMDRLCSHFRGDREACRSKKAREAYAGKVPEEAMNSACTLVGAHSERCVSNPCVNYNTGKCTLQGK
mmetsp:Transcript_17706/g.30080  ORF Transcript_17706/g.30080 Transcript_17706/m.30080 type:complete len:184 (-) Transcript_17706:1873-2424(-)